eukprot:2161833-Alexandrium_andersonii.AAC.1
MQDYVNRTRRYRSLGPGEVVFRRQPGPARLPERLFPEPSTGPYVVVFMPTDSSVVLATPQGADDRVRPLSRQDAEGSAPGGGAAHERRLARYSRAPPAAVADSGGLLHRLVEERAGQGDRALRGA